MQDPLDPWYGDNGFLTIDDDELTEIYKCIENLDKDVKCECGSDHCKSPRHSTWCPKFKK